MASFFEIPLTPSQAQKITITLNNVVYQMLFRWMDVDQGGWIVDIMDSLGAPILTSIPFTTGNDLLGQFEYLALGGALVVQSDADPDAVPTFDNLGKESHLYYVMAA